MRVVDYVIKDLISDCSYRFIKHNTYIAVYYDDCIIGYYYSYLDMLIGLLVFITSREDLNCYDMGMQSEEFGEWVKGHTICSVD